MTELIATAIKFLIAVAATQAGWHLTKFVQDEWSKRKP
jgi:hypothetical protein